MKQNTTKAKVNYMLQCLIHTLTVGLMMIIYIVQDAENSSRIASSATEDFARSASDISIKIINMLSALTAERNFTETPIINTDVLPVKNQRIKSQREKEQKDIENGKITVQVKKVNEVKC